MAVVIRRQYQQIHKSKALFLRRDRSMKSKYKFITIGGLLMIGLLSYMLHPSQTRAGNSKYKIRPDLSVEAHKSDAVRVSESYERLMGNYIYTIDNRFGQTDKGLEKISAKLDTIDKKIDDLAVRLSAIEKALNIPKGIPRPETAE